MDESFKKKLGISVIIICCSVIFSCQSDTKQVKNCFNEYKEAIINHDGNEAINYIDTNSKNYYSNILEKVKDLDSFQLEQEPVLQKLTILRIRYRFPKEEILKMNGQTLLISLINKGMTNNGNIANSTLGKITINNNLAKAEKIVKNKKTPIVFLFHKENDSWKIGMNLSSVFDIVLKQMLLDSGMPENDFLFKLLDSISSIKPFRKFGSL